MSACDLGPTLGFLYGVGAGMTASVVILYFMRKAKEALP